MIHFMDNDKEEEEITQMDNNVETKPIKATLAQEDIRFARSVERIQKIVLSEYTNKIITCVLEVCWAEDLSTAPRKLNKIGA